MDYSALPNDPENPTGSSPWASSPKQSRTSFGPPSSSDVPSSPLPPQSPYADTQRHESGFAEEQDKSSTADSGSRPNTAENGDRTHQQQQKQQPEAAQENQSPYSAQQQQHSYHPQQPQSPYSQQQQQPPSRHEPQRYHTTRARQNVPQYKLSAKVTGLERTGRKDPILRFDVYVRHLNLLSMKYMILKNHPNQTNLPKFRTTQFRDVRRTHSEFEKLAKHLIAANPEAFVPAVPPALTSAGAGTEEDEARVKAGIQRWLNTVCGNEVLMRDEEMVFFVESDFGYSPVVKRKQPATGARRKMIKQFAPPPDDTPELHEARPVVKLFYLGAMDAGQKVDKVVKARRGLGLAEADLGVKLSQMNVQETHPGLSNAYRKLGKVIQAIGDLHAAQGTAEATTLGDPLQYHSADAFIVKETLTNRQILMRELLQAQAATKSKTSAADRLKASSSVRRDKVDEAIAALDEARSHEQYLTQKTQRVTANLVQERRKWFARTSADLRQAVREYVIRQIEAERRTLAMLESVRPEIRAIDASGGLSRLGREAHPAQRRASLASSQGPKGDAWSGVPRRPDGLNRSISGGLVPPVPEDEEVEGAAVGRKRAVSGAGSMKSVQEEDEDRVDARNAASRLATTTF